MALPPAAYCRHCHWLIPVDRRGRLEPHHVSSASLVPVTCMGGRTAPPMDPPTEVASLAFAEEPPTGTCRNCRAPDIIVRSDGSLAAHTTQYNGFDTMCVGSYGRPLAQDL